MVNHHRIFVLLSFSNAIDDFLSLVGVKVPAVMLVPSSVQEGKGSHFVIL